MIQSNWARCSKCQILFYGGTATLGKCPADFGAHEIGKSDSTLETKDIYTVCYAPEHETIGKHTAARTQTKWRWCDKCYCLFYSANVSPSTCPAGGEHDVTLAADYALVYLTPTWPGQQDWNYCVSCQGLFYAPNRAQSVCPSKSGGQHAVGEASYALCTESQSWQPPDAPKQPDPSLFNALQNYFPKLTHENVYITDEPSPTYNCIAYSLGSTNQWINQSEDKKQFVAQYATAKSRYNTSYNYKETKARPALIDGWAARSPVTKMTHASRVFPVAQDLWESKLGKMYRITHGRSELESKVYGSVITYLVPIDSAQELNEAMATVPNEPELSPDELDQVIKMASLGSKESGFDSGLAAWKETWRLPPLMFSSNTRDYAVGPEFDALVQLGEAIVPLIMQRLSDEDGFFLLPLLEKVSGRDPAPKLHGLESEQSRARRAVRAFLKST